VLEYLQAHDTYRVDTCLALCEQHGVQDATAYLKERTGDMAGALGLMLGALHRAIRTLLPEPTAPVASAAAAAAAAAADPAVARAYCAEEAAAAPAAATAPAAVAGVTAAAAGVTAAGARWPSLGPRATALDAAVRRAADLCQRSGAGHGRAEVQRLWLSLLDALLGWQRELAQTSTEAGLTRTAEAGRTPAADAGPPGAGAHGSVAAARRELQAL